MTPRLGSLPVLFHRVIANHTQVKQNNKTAMPQLVECSLSKQKVLGLIHGTTSQVWWHVAVISALGRWRQEGQIFKAILGGYIVSLRLPWAI